MPCVLHIKPAVLSAAGFLFAPREPQKIIVFNGSGFYIRPFALSENCRRYPVGAAVLSLLQSMQVYHSYINAFVSEQLLHFL